MDNTDLANLVGRLERQSDAAPHIYVARVATVAALGYAGIVLAAVLILVSGYFVVESLLARGRPAAFALLALIACVAVLIAMIRALQTRIDAPAGRELAREEAPALFAAIDEIVQRMAAVNSLGKKPAVFAAIRLDREFEVAIHQIARRGVFGKYDNHLQIGVPLLAALSSAEFKTVLAHEIGHLGSERDRFTAWIYRQRTTWRLLQGKFAAPATVMDRILGGFYRWYIPYFFAYSLVLARNHEYDADRAAAQATNVRVLAQALTKVELAARFLAEVFWKRLFDQVEKSPEPRYLPYAVLPRAFDAAHKEWLRKDWLHDSLRSFASDMDTHPGLGERLAALNVQPELPSHSADASALMLFGTDPAPILKWCDQEWQQENVAAWRKKHDAIKEARWKLAQYANTPATELKAEGIWEKSTLLLDLGEDEEAIATLQELVAREDALPKAHLQLGRLLLAYGDERGLQSLTLAGQQDPELLEAAGQAGYGYLMDRGRKGEARRFWERLQAG
ncbi:MAG TPA: M48 family metalloprotease [Steroidobacteraceae bacterium]|jgi:Zn-dependent protease with chaperone function